jgi:hypothetical protein
MRTIRHEYGIIAEGAFRGAEELNDPACQFIAR